MEKRMDQAIRLQVFERDNYTCRYCGSNKPPFHADHVYPYSKGGETSIKNLVTACQKCNCKKGNKIGIWPNAITVPVNENHTAENDTSTGKVLVSIGLVITPLCLNENMLSLGFQPYVFIFWGLVFIAAGAFAWGKGW